MSLVWILKTLHFTYQGGSHVPVGILLLYLSLFSSLSQFQSTFMSFVAISSVLCQYFNVMSLVRIYPNRASLKVRDRQGNKSRRLVLIMWTTQFCQKIPMQGLKFGPCDLLDVLKLVWIKWTISKTNPVKMFLSPHLGCLWNKPLWPIRKQHQSKTKSVSVGCHLVCMLHCKVTSDDCELTNQSHNWKVLDLWNYYCPTLFSLS